MKKTLHYFFTIILLLSGVNSFAEKKSKDNLACPTATISYNSYQFCTSSNPQQVTLTGTDAYLGGVFSSTPGLVINSITGEIVPTICSPGTYTVSYTISAGGSCGAVITTTTITILPSNTVSVASSTPTLCVDTPLTPITHSTTGATGIIQNGLPTGVTASWSGNTITISGTPTTAGVFNYSIPLVGGCGTTYATGTITVLSGPGNTTISGSTTTCSGIPVNLTVTGTPGVVFTLSDGSALLTYTIGASGSIFIPVSPIVNTTYTLTSANLNNCTFPIIGQSVTVNVSATPQFINQIPDITICNGGMLNIASQLTSTIPGTTFIWSASTSNVNMWATSGDHTNIDQIVNLINSLQNGTINISVIPQIGSCSGAPQQIIVTVKPIPVINSTTANQTTICDNQFVTFTTNSNSATSYNWQINSASGVQIAGGATSGTSTTGIVDLQLALTNSLVSGIISFNITPVNGICTGATITNAVTITVNPIPGTPIGMPPNVICSGETSGLSLVAFPNIAGTILEWNVIDSNNVTGFTPSGSGLAPISINDILINTSNIQGYVKYRVTSELGNCQGGTTDYMVFVNPLPNLLNLTDGEITIDGNGNLVPFIIDTGLDTLNYGFEWHLNGTSIPSATSNTHTATVVGNYSVTVTNLTTNCQNFAEAIITENLVNNENPVDLVMYPNPSFDTINFNYISKVRTIQISNQMGQIVLTKDVNLKNGTIDLSELNMGIYNIVFETDNGTVNRRIAKK